MRSQMWWGKKRETSKAQTRKKNFNAIIIFFHIPISLTQMLALFHSLLHDRREIISWLPSGAGPVMEKAGREKTTKEEGNGMEEEENPINFTFSFFSLPFKLSRDINENPL